MGDFESSIFISGLWLYADGHMEWDLWISAHDSDIATIESTTRAGRWRRVLLSLWAGTEKIEQLRGCVENTKVDGGKCAVP